MGLLDRMSLIIMNSGISKTFVGTVSEKSTTGKQFLEEIEKHFARNDKAETGRLLENFVSIKYIGSWNIREYIMEMSNLASKLKTLKLELPKDLLSI